MIDARDRLGEVKTQLAALFPQPDYEVMTWRELMPDVVQSIELDSAGGAMMIIILYIVIGFGILGLLEAIDSHPDQRGLAFQSAASQLIWRHIVEGLGEFLNQRRERGIRP